MLTETLADAEVDIKSLKSIVEKKDDELSQSEEQCRHLGLFHLQNVHFLVSKYKAVESVITKHLDSEQSGVSHSDLKYQISLS